MKTHPNKKSHGSNSISSRSISATTTISSSSSSSSYATTTNDKAPRARKRPFLSRRPSTARVRPIGNLLALFEAKIRGKRPERRPPPPSHGRGTLNADHDNDDTAVTTAAAAAATTTADKQEQQAREVAATSTFTTQEQASLRQQSVVREKVKLFETAPISPRHCKQEMRGPSSSPSQATPSPKTPNGRASLASASFLQSYGAQPATATFLSMDHHHQQQQQPPAQQPATASPQSTPQPSSPTIRTRSKNPAVMRHAPLLPGEHAAKNGGLDKSSTHSLLSISSSTHSQTTNQKSSSTCMEESSEHSCKSKSTKEKKGHSKKKKRKKKKRDPTSCSDKTSDGSSKRHSKKLDNSHLSQEEKTNSSLSTSQHSVGRRKVPDYLKKDNIVSEGEETTTTASLSTSQHSIGKVKVPDHLKKDNVTTATTSSSTSQHSVGKLKVPEHLKRNKSSKRRKSSKHSKDVPLEGSSSHSVGRISVPDTFGNSGQKTTAIPTTSSRRSEDKAKNRTKEQADEEAAKSSGNESRGGNKLQVPEPFRASGTLQSVNQQRAEPSHKRKGRRIPSTTIPKGQTPNKLVSTTDTEQSTDRHSDKELGGRAFPRRGSLPNIRTEYSIRPVTPERRMARRASTGRLMVEEAADNKQWEITETHAVQMTPIEPVSADDDDSDDSTVTESYARRAPSRRMVRRHSTGSVSARSSESDDTFLDFWHTYEADNSQPPQEPMTERYMRKRLVRFDDTVTVWVFTKEDTPFECDLQLPQSFFPRESELDSVPRAPRRIDTAPTAPIRRSHETDDTNSSDMLLLFLDECRNDSVPVPPKRPGYAVDEDDVASVETWSPEEDRPLRKVRFAEQDEVRYYENWIVPEVILSQPGIVFCAVNTDHAPQVPHRRDLVENINNSFRQLWHFAVEERGSRDVDLRPCLPRRRTSFSSRNSCDDDDDDKIAESAQSCTIEYDSDNESSAESYQDSSANDSTGEWGTRSQNKAGQESTSQASKSLSIRDLGVRRWDSAEKFMRDVSLDDPHSRDSPESEPSQMPSIIPDKRTTIGSSRWDSSVNFTEPKETNQGSSSEYLYDTETPSRQSSKPEKDRDNGIRLGLARWDSMERELRAQSWDSTRGLIDGGNSENISNSLRFDTATDKSFRRDGRISRERFLGDNPLPIENTGSWTFNLQVNEGAGPSRWDSARNLSFDSAGCGPSRWDSTRNISTGNSAIGLSRWDSTRDLPTESIGVAESPSCPLDSPSRSRIVCVDSSDTTSFRGEDGDPVNAFNGFSVGPSRWDSTRRLGTGDESIENKCLTDFSLSSDQVTRNFAGGLGPTRWDSLSNLQGSLIPDQSENAPDFPSKPEFERNDSSRSMMSHDTIWELEEESDHSDECSPPVAESNLRVSTTRPQQTRGNSFRGLRGTDRWDSSRSLAREIIFEECESSEQPQQTWGHSSNGLGGADLWDSSQSLSRCTIREEPESSDISREHDTVNQQFQYSRAPPKVASGAPARTRIVRMNSARGMRGAIGWDSSRSLIANDTIFEESSENSDGSDSVVRPANRRYDSSRSLRDDVFGGNEAERSNVSALLREIARERSFRGFRGAERYDSSRSLTTDDILDDFASMCSTISSLPMGSAGHNSFGGSGTFFSGPVARPGAERYDSTRSLTLEDIPDEIMSNRSSVSSLRPGSLRGNSFRDLCIEQANSSLRPETVRGNSFRDFDSSWRTDSMRSFREEVIIENMPDPSGTPVLSTASPSAERKPSTRTLSDDSNYLERASPGRKPPTRTLSGDSTYLEYSFTNPDPSSRPGMWRGNSLRGTMSRSPSGRNILGRTNSRRALTRNRSGERFLVRSNSGISIINVDGSRRAGLFSRDESDRSLLGSEGQTYRPALQSQQMPSFARRPGVWRGDSISDFVVSSESTEDCASRTVSMTEKNVATSPRNAITDMTGQVSDDDSNPESLASQFRAGFAAASSGQQMPCHGASVTA